MNVDCRRAIVVVGCDGDAVAAGFSGQCFQLNPIDLASPLLQLLHDRGYFLRTDPLIFHDIPLESALSMILPLSGHVVHQGNVVDQTIRYQLSSYFETGQMRYFIAEMNAMTNHCPLLSQSSNHTD